MNWLEMHNVEFGECTVIGAANGNILMVDCGSMNIKIRENDMEVTDYIEHSLVPRYSDAGERTFLLTHFHHDHMSGLRQILKKTPLYFNTILLPAPPVNAQGRALLLEFALYVFTFLGRQSEYAQMSVSALRIFERLQGIVGMGAFFTVGKGDTFTFDKVQYDVLWPAREMYPFSALFTDVLEELDVCLSSPFLGENAPRFLSLKKQFCEEYVHCSTLCAVGGEMDFEEAERSIGRLTDLLDKIEELSDSLQCLPTAPDIAEILSRPAVCSEYSVAQNMASVVFHNCRVSEASFNDILMTGDATPETFDEIAGDLYDGYYIVKAPHHGTAGSWSHVFDAIAMSHILISNGDYHAGGMVCGEYAKKEGMKHCTNSSACNWMLENGYCCNRTAYCWEANTNGALALKCGKCNGKEGEAGCGIYIVSNRGDKGCFCDQ